MCREPERWSEFDGLRFEVLEANQRKVLRVRARKLSAGWRRSSRLS